MTIRAAMADGGIEIEIVQAEPGADGAEGIIGSIKLQALDSGPDWKKSPPIDVGTRDYHDLVPIRGLGTPVKQLLGQITMVGHEDESVNFSRDEPLTDELQDCNIQGGGPIGQIPMCGPGGSCPPTAV